ncbi:hypothetical protein BKA93DRAFT_827769 [Sparassis latifolia]
MALHPSTPPHPNDQYHHYIPRFILRNYKIETAGLQTDDRRHKPKDYKNCPVVNDDILFYSLTDTSLDKRPISSVYGEINLYKDVTNPANVQHIERKLSVLEGHAARIVGTILAGMNQGRFRIGRPDLNILRKYLFVMGYRRDQRVVDSFREDLPQNAPLVKWIRKFKRIHNLQSAPDVWLHVLNYYLDTSHEQIIRDAEPMKKTVSTFVSGNVEIDPDDSHFPAQEYISLAQGYFLCIWEAAIGDEFIVSSNSFSHRKGADHCLYPISPRAIAILSSQVFRPEISLMGSIGLDPGCPFGDIPHKSPVPTYADGGPSEMTPEAKRRYLEEAVNKTDDMFDFETTRLTVSQTQAVNALMLEHVPDTGSLTFTSKESMLRTLHRYRAHATSTAWAKHEPLLKELCMWESSFTMGLKGEADIGTAVEVDFETLVRTTINDIVSGAADREPRSHYDAVHGLFTLIKGRSKSAIPFAALYHREKFVLQQTFAFLLDPLTKPTEAQAQLVDSLSHADSDRFFAVMFRLMPPSMGIGDASRKLRQEVVLLGFCEWLMKERPDVFDGLIGFNMRGMSIRK